MTPDPSDEMKLGMEPALPWWFWPLAVGVVIVVGGIWAILR